MLSHLYLWNRLYDFGIESAFIKRSKLSVRLLRYARLTKLTRKS